MVSPLTCGTIHAHVQGNYMYYYGLRHSQATRLRNSVSKMSKIYHNGHQERHKSILLSSLWVSRTGSTSDRCALQEALYKCIEIIQYNCALQLYFLLQCYQWRIQGGQFGHVPPNRSWQWSVAPLGGRRNNDSSVNFAKF